jgi:hypothetical protein
MGLWQESGLMFGTFKLSFIGDILAFWLSDFGL